MKFKKSSLKALKVQSFVTEYSTLNIKTILGGEETTQVTLERGCTDLDLPTFEAMSTCNTTISFTIVGKGRQ